MPLRVFVIDDEPLAREGLELRLEAFEDVEVSGSFGRARAALEAVEAEPPDLLLLDVQMPGLDGFEMLSRLRPSERPAVVFVTAYDEYAVRAFEAQAVDYLLKPVDESRLATAIDQARRRLQQEQIDALGPKLRGLLDALDGQKEGDERTPQPNAPRANEGRTGSDGASAGPPSARIAVRTRGRVVMVRPGEINYVEGAGDYVELHLDDQTLLHRETMTGMEEQLAPHGFQRIHRSTIVNLDRVRALDTDRHGAYHVCLEDGPRLKLSRSYRDAFEEAIGTSF
jgi:two-component system LytT family response regulator